MRPRIFPSARQQLANACQALRQATQARPKHSQPKDHGPLIAVCLAVFISISLLGYGWHLMISHAVPVDYIVKAHVTTGNVLHGDHTWHAGERSDMRMPDGSHVNVVYRGEITQDGYNPDIQVGDMFKYGDYFWIWMIKPGASKPGWIDP